MPSLRLLVLTAALALLPAPSALAMASHVGWPAWPTKDGMLLMNRTDASRPLDARPGQDPFDGQDRLYRCDDVHLHSSSCLPRFVPVVPAGFGVSGLLHRHLDPFDPRDAIELSLPLVVTGLPGHNRLYGGHGNDTIHAAPWGDVIWGDYKPCCQPTTQVDHLYGGAGPDFVYASHGRNVIDAGDGMDIVHAHFGHGRIDCGPGRDLVYVNGAHRHRYKLRNCEVVSTRTGVSAPRWVLRRLPWM